MRFSVEHENRPLASKTSSVLQQYECSSSMDALVAQCCHNSPCQKVPAGTESTISNYAVLKPSRHKDIPLNVPSSHLSLLAATNSSPSS